MQVELHNSFKKQYRKLPQKVQLITTDRLKLFAQNPSDIKLHNHQLKGNLKNFRSINITADYRALYEDCGEFALFISVGTRS